MTLEGIDDLDRTILHMLQRDARKTTSSDIAEAAGVSASTVRNRLDRLERNGILRGYDAEVDYEQAGYLLYTIIICSASIRNRDELAEAALTVDGVVRVTEVMTGEQNVHVSVVGTDSDDLNRIGRELDELGLEVVDEDLIRNEYTCPFSGFGPEAHPDADTGQTEAGDP